jgi:hypothetical protein
MNAQKPATSGPPLPAVIPAPVELVTLVTRMRPDWDRVTIAEGVAALGLSRGWPWARVLREVIGTALDPYGSVRNLKQLALSAVGPAAGGVPDEAGRLLLASTTAELAVDDLAAEDRGAA